jgi:hypothetical protein
MNEQIDLTQLPVYEKLRENRAAMNEFFASKGWELWLELAESVMEGKRKMALYDVDPRVREEARVSFLAFEQFQGLRLHMAWALDESNADLAPGIPQATEEAKQGE